MTSTELRSLGEGWGYGWELHLAMKLPRSLRTVDRWKKEGVKDAALEPRIRQILRKRG